MRGTLNLMRGQRKDADTVTWYDLVNPTEGELRRHLKGWGIPVTTGKSGADRFADAVYMRLYHTVPHTTLNFQTVHMLVGRNIVVTWHRHPIGVWRSLRDRHEARGRIETVAALALALWADTFEVLESLNRSLGELERAVLVNPDKAIERRAFQLKRAALRIRRMLGTERDAFHRMIRRGIGTTSADNILLMEVYDQVVRLYEMADTYREMLNSVLDSYFSAISARLNEIVKTLTLVTTVMLPASLVAAVYGMNFRYLPGADTPWGFWLALGFMSVIALALLWLFRHRRWL